MGLSLWPERTRQLEILVDWQPRDWRTLLMCFSRHIYNWSFELRSRNSHGSYRNKQTDFLLVNACCCYHWTFGNIIWTFESRSKLQQQREPNITLLNWIITQLVFFLACCDNHYYGKCFLFVLSLLSFILCLYYFNSLGKLNRRQLDL